MSFPVVNNIAVLVSGIVIFLLGGLWYSPVLFAKKWVALIGKSEEELKAAAGNMPTSYLFSGKPKALWLIDSGFNLAAFIVAGLILATWR